MNYAHRLARSFAILALCGGALGCASDAGSVDEPVSSSQQALSAVDGAAGSTSTKGDERKRIRAALDAQYSSTDVVHTFEALYGDVIDCVDYYAQPGAKSLRARGKPVPDPQPQTRSARSRADMPDFMFNGKPDRYGRSRSCPDGTVPMRRVTEDEILAVGGLDAFRANNSRKRPPPDPLLPPSLVDDHHWATQLFTGDHNITSTISNISIYAPYAPAIPSTSGFTLAQTWTTTGTKHVEPDGCIAGTECIQSVEAGWHVYPDIYPGPTQNSPHLFTYATHNGYLSGCYNVVVPDPDPDPDDPDCLGFIVQPGAALAPGSTLTPSVLGNTPVEIQILVAHNANGWCLSSGAPNSVALVGCWPNSEWFGAMQTAATKFEVGGEIAPGSDGKWLIPMGSGRPPGAGFKQAAYHRDFAAFVAPDWSYSFAPNGFLDMASYGQSSKPAAGGAWTNWFYFGSEPEIGWVASPILALY